MPHIHARKVLEDVENFDKAKREEYEHKVSEKARLALVAERKAEMALKTEEDAIIAKKKRETLRRKKARRAKDRENYASSAEEDDKKVVQPEAEDVEAKSDAGSEAAKSEKPAEVEGGEADGNADVSPEAMAAYNKKLEQ